MGNKQQTTLNLLQSVHSLNGSQACTTDVVLGHGIPASAGARRAFLASALEAEGQVSLPLASLSMIHESVVSCYRQMRLQQQNLVGHNNPKLDAAKLHFAKYDGFGSKHQSLCLQEHYTVNHYSQQHTDQG